jgi:hypothetical protein
MHKLSCLSHHFSEIADNPGYKIKCLIFKQRPSEVLRNIILNFSGRPFLSKLEDSSRYGLFWFIPHLYCFDTI